MACPWMLWPVSWMEAMLLCKRASPILTEEGLERCDPVIFLDELFSRYRSGCNTAKTSLAALWDGSVPDVPSTLQIALDGMAMSHQREV